MHISWLVVAAFAGALAAPTAHAQPTINKTTTGASSYSKGMALYEATVHYKIAKDRGDEEYLLRGYALALHRDGKNAKDIVAEVKKRQQSLNATLRTARSGEWEINPRIRRGIVTIGSMLGDRSFIPGASAGLSEVANIVLDTAEDRLRPRRVHYALQRRAEQLLIPDAAKREIVRAWAKTYEEDQSFREVDRLLWQAKWQMTPLSTPEEIFAAHPDMQSELKLDKVLTRQEDLSATVSGVTANIRLVKGQLAENRVDTQKNLKEINTNVKSVNDVVKGMRSSAATRLADERAAEADRIRVAGMKSVVFLASTLIGLENPKAGHALQTIGDAGFKIHEAVQTFRRVSSGFSNLSGWASAAFTGDIVGAVLPVLGLLFDTGPSADEIIIEQNEIIIEQLGHLRGQVEQVHEQMHKRFDMVDKRLVQVHRDMIRGLNKLSEQIEEGNEALKTEIAGVRRTLLENSAKLDDLYAVTIDRTQAIRGLMVNLAIAHCVRQRQEFDEIDPKKFRDCLDKIRTLAHEGLRNGQFKPPKEKLTLAETLRSYPDETINAIAQKFRTISERSFLPKHVVGPESWAYIARTHDEFLSHWPKFALEADSLSYTQTMNGYREELEQYIKAIREDLLKYAGTGPSESRTPVTAIGKLIQEVREKKELLVRAMSREMSNLQQSYDHDLGRSSGVVTRQVVVSIGFYAEERMGF